MSKALRRDRGKAGERPAERRNPVRKEIGRFLSWLEAELRDRASKGLDGALMKRIPVLRSFGSIYTVVAVKAPSPTVPEAGNP